MGSSKNTFCAALFLLMITAARVSADFEFAPDALDLRLERGETAVVRVSLTIPETCFRPYIVDVLASDPDAPVANLTGRLTNGCGGSTSTFEIEFRGTGTTQVFELEFVDFFLNRFGTLLGSIPVTINTPARVEPLLGLLIQHNGILFQVSSNGCTTKHDFEVEIMESSPLQLRLIRLQQDPCESFTPLGTRIRFSYRRLGLERGERLRVVNPLATVEVGPRRRRQ